MIESATGHARRTSLGVAALLVALSLLGPGATLVPPARAADPVVLRIGVTSKFSSEGVNPFIAYLTNDYRLMANNYEILIAYSPEDGTSAVPGLAESWETSPDGLTWTYKVRSGATWQDGQPLTARDVAFTLNYIIKSHDPAYKGPWAPDGNDVGGGGENGDQPDSAADNPLTYFDNYLDLDGGLENSRIASVEATDAQTLVIKVSAPLITLAQMYIPIVPEHVWTNITWAEAANDALFEKTKAIGSGPFQTVEFTEDKVVRAVAFKGYWGGAPKVDEILYQFFQSTDAAIQALKSGEIDLLDGVPFSQYEALTSDPNIEAVVGRQPGFTELGFQVWEPTKARFEQEGCTDKDTCKIGPTNGSKANPWLTRVEVRRALAGLLDKVELNEKALNGLGTPGYGLMNPDLSPYGYRPPADDPLVYPTYDTNDKAAKDKIREQRTAAARAALETLGFADTDNNGILNVPGDAAAKAFDPAGAGKDFVLRLYMSDTEPFYSTAGDLIKQWFELAGVKIDKQLVNDDAVLTPAVYPYRSNADSDLFIWGWGGDPDPDFILGVLATFTINNWSDANWGDPKYDKLVKDQRGAKDLDARKVLVDEAMKYAFDQTAYAVLFYDPTLQAYRKDRWHGLVQFPRNIGLLWSSYGFGSYGSMLTVAQGAAATPAPTAAPAAPTPGPTATLAPGSTAGPATSAPVASPGPTAPPSGGTDSAGGAIPLVVGGAALVAVLAVAFVLVRRRGARDIDDDE